MNRILLVHWKEAEALERADRLRRAGYRVSTWSDHESTAYRTIREDPPEAFVIDLARLPSHGRALGVWIRQQKATRQVPIVFVEGEAEKTQRVKTLLPDAVFTGWRGIRGAVRKAIESPPVRPLVPDTMSGYSGTPLPRKLGIRAGSTVALLGAPTGFEKLLGDLPDDVTLRRRARGRADVVLLFAKSHADLERRFLVAARTTDIGGRLWVAWRKKSAGTESDVTQADVRLTAVEANWVDFKIAAFDETWSGLCFSRRASGARR